MFRAQKVCHVSHAKKQNKEKRRRKIKPHSLSQKTTLVQHYLGGTHVSNIFMIDVTGVSRPPPLPPQLRVCVCLCFFISFSRLYSRFPFVSILAPITLKSSTLPKFPYGPWQKGTRAQMNCRGREEKIELREKCRHKTNPSRRQFLLYLAKQKHHDPQSKKKKKSKTHDN